MLDIPDIDSSSAKRPQREPLRYTVDQQKARTRKGRVCKILPPRSVLQSQMRKPDFKFEMWYELKKQYVKELTISIPIEKQCVKKSTDSTSIEKSNFYQLLARERTQGVKLLDYSIKIEKNGWQVELSGLKKSSNPRNPSKYWVQCISHALVSLGGEASYTDIRQWLIKTSPADFNAEYLPWLRSMQDAVRDNPQFFRQRGRGLITFSENNQKLTVSKPETNLRI